MNPAKEEKDYLQRESRRKKENETDQVTKSALKDRGWTDKDIRDLLPEPDVMKQNPNYRSGPPMCLYNRDRVAQIEASDAFTSRASARAVRKQSALRAADTKRKKAIEYVEQLGIEIPRLTLDSLVQAACGDYNAHQDARHGGGQSQAYPSSDWDFLRRICTNFLRHCTTDYEYELVRLHGKVGIDEAHDALRWRINTAIKETYPELGESGTSSP